MFLFYKTSSLNILYKNFYSKNTIFTLMEYIGGYFEILCLIKGENMKSLLFVLPILLVGCSSLQENQKSEQEIIIPVDHDYSEVSDYDLTWETIFDVDDLQYYVYIYSSTCNHCFELKNFIIEKALDRGDIYFVKGTSKDQLTNDSKKLIGAEIRDDIWILGYPSLLKIVNKKVVKNFAGIAQIKNELN